MQFVGFDCDKGNRIKCLKHGVSAAEIEELFAGQFLTTPMPVTPIMRQG